MSSDSDSATPSAPYRIFGNELSPFSVKIRSYFRFKDLPHRWIVRNADTMSEYQKFAKIPIIPLVVTPGDRPLQDSTPIMEGIDELAPEPSTHPADPVSRFVSILLEEFGDEWGNKWMFHLRWARDEDCLAASGRAATMMAPMTLSSAAPPRRIESMKKSALCSGTSVSMPSVKAPNLKKMQTKKSIVRQVLHASATRLSEKVEYGLAMS